MGSREALVLAAHGSHLDPDSARPAFAHVDAIRARGAFGEVRPAFWKEEPSFREVLRTLVSPTVYVVPLFMSEGYFVDRILPRELRLRPEDTLDVEKAVSLTPPVGTHATMRDVILHRAESVKNGGIDRDTALVVVGHGTERHARSAASTKQHAEELEATGRFASVTYAFLDEEPTVSTIADRVDASDVVVVPLFVADGYHTTEDIPAALGIGSMPVERPAVVGAQRIWYAGAVGTDPRMVDVILERAAEIGADVAGTDTREVVPDGQ